MADDEVLETLLATPPKTIAEAKDMVKKVENNLAQTFAPSDNLDPRFEEDFEFTRDNLKDLIGEVKKTVYRISMIAYDTEKALDFQAMAQMATVLLNANKQILDIYDMKKKYLTKKDVKGPVVPVQQTNIQNAAVFNGTLGQLKDFLGRAKANEGGSVIEAEKN